MTEQLGVGFREMRDMRRIGVGERVERQALSGAFQHRRDARYFAGEDRVPPLQELRIRYADVERGAQRCKELGISDLASLMPVPDIVGRKPPDQMRGLAS